MSAFREGQMLRNKYISGKHFKYVGVHPDKPERVIVLDRGREVHFYANEMEAV